MSFSKSQRKATTRITPVKISGERRNTVQVEDTVKNTLHSAWTPTKGGVLNSQLFEERKCLIGHWFEHWTDCQRRQFLEHLVQKFNKMSVNFVHERIKDKITAPPSDFTRTLPQYVSFKIFSHLDPRTLAQASLVSWHWKWISEHDVVWKPKCLKRGWDYGRPEPPYERAVWKRFYQQQVWDLLHPAPPPPPASSQNFLDVTEEDGLLNTSAESTASRRSSGGRKKPKPSKPKTYKLGEAQPLNIGYLKHKEQELPPWRSSDNKPQDMQLFNKQILGISSENVPHHISEKFTKVEITRIPGQRCTSPMQRTRSIDQITKRGGGKDRMTPSPSSSPLQSKSMVKERTSMSPTPGVLKSSSSNTMVDRTPVRRTSNPPMVNKRNQQSPMVRKLTGINNKTMSKVAQGRKKALKTPGMPTLNSDEIVDIPTAWGTPDRECAKKVASTDTLGSDAALDIESNDSLSIYGDDSGKLNGEAWELHSNISDA